jgi:hypothetical protein
MRDQPGAQRMYKLVKDDGTGWGNGQGLYPEAEAIIYEIGNSYAVADANTDETVDCGAGINLATLRWCMEGWQPGYRILLAEFTAADIAAIPIGTDGKFRVHCCNIVGEKNLVELGLVTEDDDGN